MSQWPLFVPSVAIVLEKMTKVGIKNQMLLSSFTRLPLVKTYSTTNYLHSTRGLGALLLMREILGTRFGQLRDGAISTAAAAAAEEFIIIPGAALTLGLINCIFCRRALLLFSLISRPISSQRRRRLKRR